MTPEEIYQYWGQDLVDKAVAKMSALAPGPERTALAFDYFGRRGHEVLPWIDELSSRSRPEPTALALLDAAVANLAITIKERAVADWRKLLSLFGRH